MNASLVYVKEHEDECYFQDFIMEESLKLLERGDKHTGSSVGSTY